MDVILGIWLTQSWVNGSQVTHVTHPDLLTHDP